MRRPLLTFFAALSLLLCLSVCVMWVRSYRVLETRIFETDTDGYSVASGHGAVLLKVVRDQPPAVNRWRYYADDASGGNYVMARTDRRYFGGFLIESGQTRGHVTYDSRLGRYAIKRYAYRSLILPYWSLAAATAALPVLRLTLRVWKRAATPGLCGSCGYDLRATPGRCPECGKATA